MSHKTTDVSFVAYMPLEIKFHGTLNPIKKRLSLVFKLNYKKNYSPKSDRLTFSKNGSATGS